MEILTNAMQNKLRLQMEKKTDNKIADAICVVQVNSNLRRRSIRIQDIMMAINASRGLIRQANPNAKKIKELVKDILEVGLLNIPRMAQYKGQYYLIGGRHRSLAINELNKIEMKIMEKDKSHSPEFSSVVCNIIEVDDEVEEKDFHAYLTRQIISDNESRVMSSNEKEVLASQAEEGDKALSPFDIYLKKKGTHERRVELMLKTYIPMFYEDELGKASWKTFVSEFTKTILEEVEIGDDEDSINFVAETMLSKIVETDSKKTPRAQVADCMQYIRFAFEHLV